MGGRLAKPIGVRSHPIHQGNGFLGVFECVRVANGGVGCHRDAYRRLRNVLSNQRYGCAQRIQLGLQYGQTVARHNRVPVHLVGNQHTYARHQQVLVVQGVLNQPLLGIDSNGVAGSSMLGIAGRQHKQQVQNVFSCRQPE